MKDFYTTFKSYFAGIDPSLTGTAVVIIDEQGRLIHSKVCNIREFGPARLAKIRDMVCDTLTSAASFVPIALIGIEHYAMGCKFGREAAGELGGVLRVMLWENGYEYCEIPPLRLKQFATGQAKAEKDHVLMAVYKKWGKEFKTNDEADAFVLAQMARAVTMVRRGMEIKLTTYEREVIENILNPAKKSKGTKGKKNQIILLGVKQ